MRLTRYPVINQKSPTDLLWDAAIGEPTQADEEDPPINPMLSDSGVREIIEALKIAPRIQSLVSSALASVLAKRL